MSANFKLRIAPDAAMLDLWRVAETGDVAELAHILPRVGNINARNEHGMTALMRAAYHGHERMVRALLDHGADPNLTRNDKFTALALAAFFGHTETVRTLIERGARTEVVTRCGASAHMWATARTFVDAARCLESTPAAHASKPVTPAKTAPVTAVKKRPAAVKTLKDPPEIWELVQVQEAPKSFNARSAFMSRLQSMTARFALRAAAAVFIAATCLVGAWLWRGSQTRSLKPEITAVPVETKVTAAESVEAPKNEPVAVASSAEIEEVSVPNPVRNHGSHKGYGPARQVRAISTVSEQVMDNPSSKEAPAPPVVAKPQVEARSSSKVNTALSPQLITPAKSGAPKAKVIQWP